MDDSDSRFIVLEAVLNQNEFFYKYQTLADASSGQAVEVEIDGQPGFFYPGPSGPDGVEALPGSLWFVDASGAHIRLTLPLGLSEQESISTAETVRSATPSEAVELKRLSDNEAEGVENHQNGEEYPGLADAEEVPRTTLGR